MFITVPFKNKVSKKIQKKHQDSIIKEIQHSNIIDQLTRDQLLKRSSLLQVNNIHQNYRAPQRLSLTVKSATNSVFSRPRTSHQPKQTIQQQHLHEKRINKTRHSVRKPKQTTLFDLKINQMNKIITTVHKQTIDQMNQKDRIKITKNGWFLLENSVKNKDFHISTKVAQVKKLVKRKIRDHQANVFVQNSATTQTSPYCSILHSPRQRKVQLEQEQIQQFYNLARGGIDENEYSNAISLKEYQKSKSSFYILRNMQDNIKNGVQFKKISLQNFGRYKNGKLMPFIYLKQNKFRKYSSKQKHHFVKNNIVE